MIGYHISHQMIKSNKLKRHAIRSKMEIFGKQLERLARSENLIISYQNQKIGLKT